MRKYLPLVLIIIAICLATLAGTYLFEQPGYIKIAYGDSYIETTILSFGLVLIALWLLDKFLAKLWGLFGYRRKRAENILNMGLSAYLLKDWTRAEKLLSKEGPKGQLPQARKLFAALAASKLGKTDKVTEHLASFDSKDPHAKLLTVELLLENGQVDEAYQQISPLFIKKPRDNAFLSLFVRTLQAKGQWDELLEALPRVAKQELFDEQQFDVFAEQTIRNALVQTGVKHTFAEVEQQWKKIPNKFKKPSYAQAIYIEQLATNQQGEQAEKLLLKLLKKGDIADYLPLLRTSSFTHTGQLNQFIQKSLKTEQNNIGMLCALGYLAINNSDYPLAAKALEKAYEVQTQLTASEQQILSKADLMVLVDAYARTAQHAKAVLVFQHINQHTNQHSTDQNSRSTPLLAN